MEEWSKYVFDPKNPTDFKAYKLLKKILKDGNTLLVTDMYYFNELFKNEIWTQDVIDELWDKPDNFEELSSNEKAKVYIENYSEADYLEKITTKEKEINSSRYAKAFKLFATNIETILIHEFPGEPDEFYWTFTFDYEISIKGIDFLSKKIEDKNIIASFEDTPLVVSDKNCIFFLRGVTIDELFPFLELQRASVFLYEEEYLRFLYKNRRKIDKPLHPIMMQHDEDLHLLLDFLIRDIENENTAKLPHQANTYLDSIHLKNYFSIENIHIQDLANKKEIYLMGENGDGKTILLQAIALALRGNQNVGTVSDIVKQNPYQKLFLKATTSDGEEYSYKENPKNQEKSFNAILGYGIERFRNDSDKVDKTGYVSLFDKETYLENPEKWLQHLDYKESKGDTSEISLTQAIEILKDVLEKDAIEIRVTPDKVTFTEKGTELHFNQLSDGYQSVIIWVCDLIARLSKLQPYVSHPKDYSGVVLVDEIGAYLHPKWAYGIVKKLREWFKNLQFIFTTHNPIVILGASEDAAFYKVYKENGKTKVSEPVEDISDLMLNSLVTSPLFNLPTARPKGFDESNDLSDDDYIYRRIHQLIQQKLQTMPNLVDEDVIKMIEAELEKV